MACRGVHFAVSSEVVDHLLSAKDDESLMAIIEEIEEVWDEDNLAESDKAWDAIHRLLTDGTLGFGNGEYPLNHCIFGPRQLHNGEDNIVSIVLPAEVRDVAKALNNLTRDQFVERYQTIVPNDYAPEYGDEDLEYSWANFDNIKKLYQSAAAAGQAVVFTVDQ